MLNSKHFYKTTRIFFIMQTVAEVFAVNVAYHRNATYCGKTQVSEKLFDGDLRNGESITESCADEGSIEIDLGSSYFIRYVVVYGGKENYETYEDQLDNFVVNGIYDSERRFCAQYSKVSLLEDIEVGVRVNCQTSCFYPNIGIQSRSIEGLNVAEIEVHTFGSLEKPYSRIFRGCYDDFNVTETTDFESCLALCITNKFMLAGIKGSVCGCIENFNSIREISWTKCNKKCGNVDNLITCGGAKGVSVYIVFVPLPTYQGCLRTSVDYIRTSTIRGDMTLIKCLQQCANHNYALIQNGDYCMCENSIAGDMVSIENCKVRCTGDPNALCGGEEYASAYSTCRVGLTDGEVTCTELFHCSGKYDIYGVCMEGCIPGYFGEHCLEQDLDECTLEACDSKTMVCKNLLGSYKCLCKLGFRRSDDSIFECIDVDECDYSPCHVRSEFCINLPGNFTCDCRLGFARESRNTCEQKNILAYIQDVPNFAYPAAVLALLVIILILKYLNRPKGYVISDSYLDKQSPKNQRL